MTHLRIALFSLLGLLACSKAVNPLPDKNTNWLRACDEDAECGSELACLCGACTKDCVSDAQCGRTAPGATCLAARDPSIQALCGTQLKAAALCSAECQRDSDCERQADGLRCEAGVCVPRGPRCTSAESCATYPCAPGSRPASKCDDQGAATCWCAPELPEACTPGEMVAKICGMDCPRLNEIPAATCGADGHFGPCTCQEPGCGPAADCVPGYVCVGNRCLEAANRCNGILCDAGAQCLDDACVQVLVDGLSSPGDLGIGESDGALYFVNTGTYDSGGQFNFDAMLARVWIGGGDYERLREDLNQIGRAVFTGSGAYWFNTHHGKPFQVSGKRYFSDQPTSIFLTEHAQSALLADDDAFYWLEQADPLGPVELMTATRANIQPQAQRVIELPHAASVLALDGDRLYWGTVDDGLWSVEKDGSDMRLMVTPAPSLRGPSVLAAGSPGLLWAWARGSESVGVGLYAPSTEAHTRLTEDMSGRIGEHLAFDDDWVYWIYAADGDDQYSLLRTKKAPYRTEVLWRSAQLTATTKLLAHEGFIYVSTLSEPGKGKILRVQLPR